MKVHDCIGQHLFSNLVAYRGQAQQKNNKEQKEYCGNTSVLLTLLK